MAYEQHVTELLYSRVGGLNALLDTGDTPLEDDTPISITAEMPVVHALLEVIDLNDTTSIDEQRKGKHSLNGDGRPSPVPVGVYRFAGLSRFGEMLYASEVSNFLLTYSRFFDPMFPVKHWGCMWPRGEGASQALMFEGIDDPYILEARTTTSTMVHGVDELTIRPCPLVSSLHPAFTAAGPTFSYVRNEGSLYAIAQGWLSTSDVLTFDRVSDTMYLPTTTGIKIHTHIGTPTGGGGGSIIVTQNTNSLSHVNVPVTNATNQADELHVVRPTVDGGSRTYRTSIRTIQSEIGVKKAAETPDTPASDASQGNIIADDKYIYMHNGTSWVQAPANAVWGTHASSAYYTVTLNSANVTVTNTAAEADLDTPVELPSSTITITFPTAHTSVGSVASIAIKSGAGLDILGTPVSLSTTAVTIRTSCPIPTEQLGTTQVNVTITFDA